MILMKISMVVISTAIVVSLVGCSSSSHSPSASENFIAKPLPAASTTQPLPADTAQSEPAPNVTPKSTIPRPNAAQEESLLAELSKINPGIITAKTVNHARDQCSSLYPMSPSAIKNAQTRFNVFRGHQVTLDEAEAINNVILSNGFCKNI